MWNFVSREGKAACRILDVLRRDDATRVEWTILAFPNRIVASVRLLQAVIVGCPLCSFLLMGSKGSRVLPNVLPLREEEAEFALVAGSCLLEVGGVVWWALKLVRLMVASGDL